MALPGQGNSLTQRDFYVAVGATTTDLKSISDTIQDGGEDDGEIGLSFGEILKSRWKQLMGQDSSQHDFNRLSMARARLAPPVRPMPTGDPVRNDNLPGRGENGQDKAER